MLHSKEIGTKLQCLLRSLRIHTDSATVFAAIVFIDKSCSECTIVSLGVGQKCLPEMALGTFDNDLVHDSHAEILARRGLIHFIFDSLLNGEASAKYFAQDDDSGKFRLNGNYQVCLVTSRSPCTLLVMRSACTYCYRWRCQYAKPVRCL